MQEAELMQKSADPLPIRHNGGIRWQGVSYGGGCEGMAAAAATATVTALTDTATTATATAAAATAMVQAQQEPAVEGAVEERVLGDLTSEPITKS